MSKQDLIKKVGDLLNPKSEYEVFRFDEITGMYKHKGRLITKAKAMETPTRCAIFLTKKIVKSGIN